MTALESITLSSRIDWYHEMHVNEHGKAAEHFAVEVHEDVLEDWVAVAAGLEAEVALLRAYGEARAAHRKAEAWMEELRYLPLKGTRHTDGHRAEREAYFAMQDALDRLHAALDKD